MKSSEVQNNEEKRLFKGHATPIHQPFHERGKNCSLRLLFGCKISFCRRFGRFVWKLF